MKQKINLRPFFLFLMGMLFALPAMAEEYGKTFHIEKEGQSINAIEFMLHEGAGSPDILTRIVSKNGYYFFINLPDGHQISDLHGGTLIGDKIKVTSPGTLDFEFTYQNTRYYILADVNYKGVLQYNGSDAPETIEVTQENENEKVYFPPGKFKGVRWYGLSSGTSTHLSEIPDGTPEVTLSFLKNSGFTEFKVRTRDGTSNRLPDLSPGGTSWNKFSITVPAKQYTVTLSAQPTNGGTVSGAGKFEENTEVTVVATPKEGWRFIRWTESGTEVSTSSSYTFPITKNRTLVAHFEKIPPKQYTVTLSAQPNDGGTVSGAGKFEENTEVTVVATPKEGWRFVRWTESGTEVSTSSSYAFPITNNRTLVAQFEKIPPKQYTVTLSANPTNGGTVSGAGKFEENTEVTVVATPKEGWKFIRWTESGTEVSTSSSYSFPITKNRTFVAHFEKIPPKQCTVTLSAQPNDGGTVSGEGRFEENTEVTVVATPKEGWKFIRWTESGTEVSTSSSYSFPITKNRTLVAHFEKIPPKQYTVTLSAQPSDGGTVSGAGRFEENTQVTVVATPKEGWKFIRWTESGTEVSTSVSYSFPITNNRTLVAHFEKIPPKQYTVTLSAQPSDGGTVSGAGKFEENTEVTVVATPKEGWRFVRWTESGTEVSTSASYSFPITKNRTLVAQFEKIPPKQYTVTLSAQPSDGGTVSGEGRFEENTQVTVVATPKEGWKFIRWTESGTEVSTSASYSFPITNNRTLVAQFEKIPPKQYTVTLSANPSEGGTVSGEGRFEENTQVTVVATPKEGWKFIRWTESGTEVSTSASYAFPITNNRTLVAHFEKIPPKQYTVTLSANPTEGGTVSGAGKFEENTEVTVVATPKEGWRFVRWTESGTEVSTSASYAFPITKNRTLVAHFEKIPPKQYTVTLSANPSEGGTVSGEGRFEENTQVTVVATPKEGWKFIRWTESGTEVSTSASYAFPITKNRTLVAHFEKIPPKQYTVTLSAQPTDGGTVSGAGKFEENTEVTVVATPKEGWRFVRWTESGTEVSTSVSYSFPITNNRTLVAHFEKIPPKQYTVTLSAQPSDGGTVSGAGRFEENTQVTVVATPKEGWRFVRWTESGTEVSTSASYSFRITSNLNLVAVFEKIPIDPEQLLPHLIGLGSTPIKRGEIKTYLWEDLHEDVANFNFKLFTTEDNSASTGIKVNKLNANEVELQFVEEGKFTLVIEFEVNGKNFYLSYDLTVEN